jgi:hypothetical protein
MTDLDPALGYVARAARSFLFVASRPWIKIPLPPLKTSSVVALASIADSVAFSENCDLPDTLRRPLRLGDRNRHSAAMREQHEDGESHIGLRSRRGSSAGRLYARSNLEDPKQPTMS